MAVCKRAHAVHVVCMEEVYIYMCIYADVYTCVYRYIYIYIYS